VQISVLVAIISCDILEGRSGKGFPGNSVCPGVSRKLRGGTKLQKRKSEPWVRRGQRIPFAG